MEDGFQVLEEKVRRTADLVTRLRGENEELKRELARLAPRLQEAEQKSAALEATLGEAGAREKAHGGEAKEARRAEALGREVKALRDEREEVRRRIAKLVEVLDGLE
jgi:FtsZ-binding cell division protein ZapB